MKVKFIAKNVISNNDIFETNVEIKNADDYIEKRQAFADLIGVEYNQIDDDIDPEDYIDLFGVSFFGDR